MNRIFISSLFIVLLSSCTTMKKLTNDEISLINNAAVEMPFRVLQIDNTVDSLLLRTKSTDINFRKDKAQLQTLIQRMRVTMDLESGVGLAAVQIGILRNVFLFPRIDKANQPVEVVINPRIIELPAETICFERDGCLSVPDYTGNTVRYPWIMVEYFNEQGYKITEKLEGYSRTDNFVAVIFQHEFDHLQCVIYTDKLCP